MSGSLQNRVKTGCDLGSGRSLKFHCALASHPGAGSSMFASGSVATGGRFCSRLRGRRCSSASNGPARRLGICCGNAIKSLGVSFGASCCAGASAKGNLCRRIDRRRRDQSIRARDCVEGGLLTSGLMLSCPLFKNGLSMNKRCASAHHGSRCHGPRGCIRDAVDHMRRCKLDNFTRCDHRFPVNGLSLNMECRRMAFSCCGSNIRVSRRDHVCKG